MIITDIDYSDMSKIGEARIHQDGWKVKIAINGFEYKNAQSCRESAIKSMLYLRDLLDAQIAVEILVPGGNVGCSVD